MKEQNKNIFEFNNKTQETIKKDKEIEQIDKCECWFKGIENEMYLWDMRTWNCYKDPNEVMNWILDIKVNGLNSQTYSKNCGHSVWCIYNLLKSNVSEERILESIMKNPNKLYSNVKIKNCWNSGNRMERIMDSIHQVGVENWFKLKGLPINPDSKWKNRYTAYVTTLNVDGFIKELNKLAIRSRKVNGKE